MNVSTYQQRIGKFLDGIQIGEIEKGERVIISNFLFYCSYTIMFLHPLFYLRGHNLESAIVVGLAIFGSLQVGGFFFLESISKKYSTSMETMLLMRVLATVLLAIPSTECIIVGFALLGMSHSMFFVTSRMLLGKLKLAGNAFFKLSLSTNLSYFLAPGVGALLIEYLSLSYVGFIISLLFSFSSYYVLKQVKMEEEQESSNEDAKIATSENTLTVVKDCLLFALFVLPYTVMMTLVSVKTYLANYSPSYSSLLFGINSIIVIIFLGIYIKMDTKDNVINIYLPISIAASLLCIGGMYFGYFTFVLIFIVWSVCEAYQGPAIEKHIFSIRNYPKSQLKWIVGVDGVCSFIGPVLAGNIFFARFFS